MTSTLALPLALARGINYELLLMNYELEVSRDAILLCEMADYKFQLWVWLLNMIFILLI
jgi:hypothetical protein